MGRRGGQVRECLEKGGGESGLLPQDVMVGGGKVLLGGDHVRGEASAGEMVTGALVAAYITQDGEAGESHSW